MTTESARRKPRADAVQNRALLIEAAKEVLGRGGPGASLEAVARRAGVGIGTLYRHFPTREDLFQAAYRHEALEMAALADRLAVEDPGTGGLRRWAHALVAMVATKRGMLGALAVTQTDSNRAMYAEVSVTLAEAIGRLLQNGIDAGLVRPDIGVEDFLGTVMALCYAREPAPGWEAQVLRVLDIFVDGLAVR